MNEGYVDDYTQLLPMYPISNIFKDKEALLITEEKQLEKASDIIRNQTSASKGSWDYTIDKCTKAIKLHSISEKPKKKRGQSNNDAYKRLMAKTEYNPFLHNVWMLLAEARFHKGQFLSAASTFNYIARIYDYDKDIEAEARIWAARSYLELEWFFEAEDILNKLNNDKLPASQNNWFSAVNADFLLKRGKLREALPFLVTAAKNADTKRQKARMTFLLGQVYTELGDRNKAYQAFRKVPSFNPHYELEFNARIKQTEVFPESNPDKILKMLKGMAKSSKNENYLEQIYYAIGNIHLSQRDTTKAVENYVLGVEKATRSGMEKAILLITLGDVYFNRQQYIEAQPCFSEAISIIQKGYKDYERVAKLSETLDELVGYVEEVQLQDSLQLLALKPESERIAIVQKIIEEIERKEKEERELAERESRLAENRAMGPGMNRNMPTPTMPGGDNSFYFYNTTAVSNGRNEFQRKWGKRKLEDNWRRRDKSATYSETEESALADSGGQIPSEGVDSLQAAKASDAKSVEYYLQQIPTTPEQLENSNAVVADGYFNMALIYKNKLEDYLLAINEFNRLENRYPDNEYRLEAYYNAFLMYLRMKNTDMANLYKMKLIEAFPTSSYAIAVSDPNFEYSITMMNQKQDSLYEATYNAYLANNIRQVNRNYEIAKNEYPLSKLMPKFMLLDAFTHASTGNVNEFRNVLNEIVEKYPESDVNQLVGEMLKSLSRGRRPAVGGQVRGMLWNMRIGGDDMSFVEGDSIPDIFNDDPNVPYLMAIVYPNETVNTNELLFAVANYNFTHLLTRNFDLDTFSFNDISMVLIKNFVNFEEIAQYYQMFRSDNVIAEVSRYTQPLLISTSNFDKLIEGYSISQYMEFYEEKFGTDAPVDINQYLIQEEVVQEEKTEMESDTISEGEQEDIIPEGNSFSEPVIIAPKEMPIIQPGVIDSTKTTGDKGIDPQQVDDTIEDALEKIEDTTEEIKRKAKEKWNDLIYGKPELTDEEKAEDEHIKAITKAEKAAEKALKKEAKAKEKAEKKAKAAEDRAKKKDEREAQKEIDQLEKGKVQAEENAKDAERKAQEDAKKEAEKQKKDAVKTKEAERRDKEKERKETLKQKEAERKAKEKERKELQKQKEKEREERLKERERQRKEAEKNRKAGRSIRK